jgi:metallophosphoesterase (TIGR00282 family)
MREPTQTGGRTLDILFIGDIIGRPGREMASATLDRLRQEGMPDVVIANGENSAGGFGLTEATYHELLNMGIQVVTMGNHTWDKNEIFDFISEADCLVRPLNYPEGTPGRGWTITQVDGITIAVINVMGRAFMSPMDCPFRAVDKALNQIGDETNIIFVDVHAEATAEKRALAYHLDGRVSAVVGTHTHVQTADETILPKGTAFLTDAGMTGPIHSVIGMKVETAVRKMVTQLPCRLEVAEGPAQFNGVRVRVDRETGRAIAIERLNYR